MKILVTGGAGFIGSHLVDRLIQEGYKVFVIDNLSEEQRKDVNPKSIFYKEDITNLTKILPLLKNIDYVFHLAAQPRAQYSVEKPIEVHQVNVNGTLNVLYASYKNKVKRVIFSSSSAVYGEQKALPLKETMTPNPLSPYGLHKLIGEQYSKLFSTLYNLETVSLRYFNVYGPRINPEGPYALVIGRFLKLKKKVTLNYLWRR